MSISNCFFLLYDYIHLLKNIRNSISAMSLRSFWSFSFENKFDVTECIVWYGILESEKEYAYKL